MLLVPDNGLARMRRCSARVSAENGVPDALRTDWAELAADAAEPNAFGEAWFMEPALAHLRMDRHIRLIEVRDDSGILIGVMPLTLYGRYGRIPARHVSNWAHYQCFMGTPLVRKTDEQGFWLAVIALLDRSDWARGFLSVTGLLEDGPVHRGLMAAAEALERPCPTVHRYERAALASTLSPDTYLEEALRGKKRKELRRLANRLAEMGPVRFKRLTRHCNLDLWCDDFLELEASGWKGTDGSAFANAPETEAFFYAAMKGAYDADRLDFQRLDLDGQAIAMLVNFRTPPGSWSFKIAYDEALARFSPGVLIELENLPLVLADGEVDWMDSCAVEDHPMINSLWMERRAIVQVSVPLSGARRLVYAACRSAERTSAAIRGALRS